MDEIKIINARIVDGGGNPHFWGEICINNAKISGVAKKLSREAITIIDAKGMILCPGFIDAHGHSDLNAAIDKKFENRLLQGITTEVSGTCGLSQAPMSKEKLTECAQVCSIQDGSEEEKLKTRSTFKDYLNEINTPFAINLALHVGHGVIRACVMGYANRKPTDEELNKMRDLTHEAMRAGALGISFGLIYPPGSYADTEELTSLCEVVAQYGGTCAFHMRSESTALIAATEEVIEIAHKTKARCIISHHKSLGGIENWGKTETTLRLIDNAVKEGADIFFDQYPYIASATGLNTNIPQHMHELGAEKLLEMLIDEEGKKELKKAVLDVRDEITRFKYTMIGHSDAYSKYVGWMLNDAAEAENMSSCEFLFDMLYKDKLTSKGIYFGMCEEDIERVMKHPRGMIGTDGSSKLIPFGGHPRAWASFPRVLGRYVRERQVLTLEEAIRKMTSLTAAVYNFKNKGMIRENMDADIVIFDDKTILDNATFSNPTLPADGIKYVFVSGELAVEDGVLKNTLSGKLILPKEV